MTWMRNLAWALGFIFSSKLMQFNDLDNPFDFGRPEIKDSYDFIIVGGGTTGSVIASRLTENPRVKVLVLEAGSDGNVLSLIPAAGPLMWWDSNFDYRYTSEPQKDSCLALEGGRCRWFRGRMLGGSSALNGAMYTRGNHKDYDNWAALGNPGWSFRDLLPLFLRAENFLVKDVPTRDAIYHESNRHRGYFPVSYTHFSELLPAFIEAGESLGFPHNRDYNGASQRGFSGLQQAVKDGIRYSTALAYLVPGKHRKNLHVVVNTIVSRIVIDESTKTAKGVEYLAEDGTKRFVSARKEVILSAGAIASPQILMLSGIGPKEELRRHGIRPFLDLRVGENMQSHYGSGGIYFSIEKSTGFMLPRLFTTDFVSTVLQFVLRGEGPFTTSAGFEGIAFVNTSFAPDPEWPDMEFLFNTQTMGTDGGVVYRRVIGLGDQAWTTYRGLLQKPGFEIFPLVQRPKSRGKILLRSTNVRDHPIIIGNFFKHPVDLHSTIEAIRMALRLGEHPAFKKFGAKFYSRPLPGCKHLKQFTDRYWECHIRQFTSLIFHDVGTCKMGPPTDPGAVVDPTLRVYGLKNLRVADASIMPVIITGHPMSACIVIGEKASDLIKSSYNL